MINFFGMVRRGAPGWERRTRERRATGRHPAIVYTGCAPRRNRGGGCCVLALARLGPRATFLNSRGRSPWLQEDFFLLPKKGKMNHCTVLHIYSLGNPQQKLFPPAQMYISDGGFSPLPPHDFCLFNYCILVIFSCRLSTATPLGDPPPVLSPPSPTHRPHSTGGLNREGSARVPALTLTLTRAHALRPRSPLSATHSDTHGWGRKAGGRGVLLTFEGSRFRLLAARHPKSKQLKLFQFSPVRNYTSSWPRAPRAAAPRALRSASLAPSLRAPLLAPAPARARARGSRLPGLRAPRGGGCTKLSQPSTPTPNLQKKKKGGGEKKGKEKKTAKKILCRTMFELPSNKLKKNPLPFLAR